MRLFMVSAMYENGGNTTHRFLDGHPELMVYPFESQLGNRATSDYLTSFVPIKYRWPEFPTASDHGRDFERFFDEEYKTRVRVPHVSKFRDADFDVAETDRKAIFIERMAGVERTNASIIYNFFAASFDAWKNFNRPANPAAMVGYSPVVGIDADRIFRDFPDGHVIHVVRNPWSGYADTIKRPFPLSLHQYVWTWNIMQLKAMAYERLHPGFHIVRFEDLVADPRATMTDLSAKLKIGFDDALLAPSWNSKPMENVYPWGTIRIPTPEKNLATANELDDEQKAGIRGLAGDLLGRFDYEGFLPS